MLFNFNFRFDFVYWTLQFIQLRDFALEFQPAIEPSSKLRKNESQFLLIYRMICFQLSNRTSNGEKCLIQKVVLVSRGGEICVNFFFVVVSKFSRSDKHLLNH